MASELLVVAGKDPIPPFADASLSKLLLAEMEGGLVPGTRLEPVQALQNGGAETGRAAGSVQVKLALKEAEIAKLEGNDWRRSPFWLPIERLKRIPAKPSARCVGCGRVQPLHSFSRAARVKLKGGQSARCLGCAANQDCGQNMDQPLRLWPVAAVAAGSAAVGAAAFLGLAALLARRPRGRGSSPVLLAVLEAVPGLQWSRAILGAGSAPSPSSSSSSSLSSPSSCSSSSSSSFSSASAALAVALAASGSLAASLLASSVLRRLLSPTALFDVQEAERHVVPLPLVGESSDEPWEPLVEDSFHRSFSSLLRSRFDADFLKAWYQRILRETPWERPETRGGTALPRQAAWFVGRGCRCSYEYNGTKWAAHQMPEWLLELEEAVWAKFGTCGEGSEGFERPNSCVLNLYKDGSEAVEWHADNEDLFDGLDKDCRIVSFSLGATRTFEMKKRRRSVRPGAEPLSARADLAAGDIVTMEGRFQRHWSHRVPKQLDVMEPRINLTWRHILRHEPSCPLHDQR